MAIIQAEIKRGMLRSLYRAGGNGSSLLDALTAFQTTGFNAIKTGKLVISTAGAGHSVSFGVPTYGQWTQDQVFALSEELLQIYDDALVTLSAAGNSSPDDATIYATMKADDRLQTIRAVQIDQTALRYPATALTR